MAGLLIPAEFRAAETPRPAPAFAATPPPDAWRACADPQPDAPTEETLAANPDLKIAAARLTAPLLDGGRRAARTESARAELAIATETFASLTVRAFQETADALAAVEAARAEREAASAILAARRELRTSAEARRAAGRIARLTFLAADDDVLVAETELVRAHLAEQRALLALAKTLGGDWPAASVALAAHP